MKNISTILSAVLFFISLATFAQVGVDTVFVTPSNPTTIDSVKVTAYTTFGSGGCDTLGIGVTMGSWIYIDACHESGMAAYICHDSVTINLGLLAAAKYDLGYIIRRPNPVTDPTDCAGQPILDSMNISFTVTTASGIDPIAKPVNTVLLFPNPANNAIAIHYVLDKNDQDAVLAIYNMIGQTVKRIPLEGKKGAIIENISNLSKGSYFYRIETPTLIGIVDRLNIIE